MKFWSVEELAEFLRVPKTWIYERTRENGPELIPHVKLGKYVRFDPGSVAFQDWLRNHEVGPSLGGVPNKVCETLKSCGQEAIYHRFTTGK